MRFTVQEIVDACGGIALERSAGLADTFVDGVSIDSREIAAGELFVPIVADRDGHDYVDAARERGVSVWLTQRPDSRLGAIQVVNSADALTALGHAARRRLEPVRSAIIGVTGSSGKTSTKDLIRGALLARGGAGASEKSLNNEMGVPLTLCNTPDDAWACVLEMGARGIGHISDLCAIARPTVGVVTNVGTAHSEMYEMSDGILRAKGELVEALPSEGTAVLNADDPSHQAHAASTIARVLTFSALGSSADVVAEGIAVDAELRSSFRLRSPWGEHEIRLSARGLHQVSNALAAAAASLSIGLSLDELAEGLSTEELSPWRMEFSRTSSGAVVINDAYNANDKSMEAALQALSALRAGRKIAVLGTMAELGRHADNAHRRIVESARSLGIDVVVSVAEPRYLGADFEVGSVSEAHELLATMGLSSSDAVLVKGSRSTGMERVAQRLLHSTSEGSK